MRRSTKASTATTSAASASRIRVDDQSKLLRVKNVIIDGPSEKAGLRGDDRSARSTGSRSRSHRRRALDVTDAHQNLARRTRHPGQARDRARRQPDPPSTVTRAVIHQPTRVLANARQRHRLRAALGLRLEHGAENSTPRSINSKRKARKRTSSTSATTAAATSTRRSTSARSSSLRARSWSWLARRQRHRVRRREHRDPRGR